ncbi:MAG: EAL domain-containing protein, partial [Rhodocyclaceae bacterium]
QGAADNLPAASDVPADAGRERFTQGEDKLLEFSLEDIPEDLVLDDIFDWDETQRIQDAFSDATGVASIITYPDGRPFTRPSNFSNLCKNIIRKTDAGLCNCMKSDAELGKVNPDGPIIQPCLSGGLVDGGASIVVGGRHIGNWLIGQVLSGPVDVDRMMAYAREIGADEAEYRDALAEITRMPAERFRNIGQALFIIAKQLSTSGLKNVMLTRHVEKLRATEEKLQRLALYDGLTGLPNRTFLQESLGRAIEQARHSGDKVALLFIDIDRFKHVNDTRGHSAGDELLRQAAVRLQGCCGPGDIVARLGGDEFLVVVQPAATAAADAGSAASRIVESMAQPFVVEDIRHFVSASIGIAVFPDDGISAERLMQCADTAMYCAKEAGRNGYRLFSADMNARVLRRSRVEDGLRVALQRGEFELHYQPIHDLEEGRLVGAEALLRWNNPAFSDCSPGEFIPLAEETGLIVPIGAWVLETACRAALGWPGIGRRLFVAVNVSSRELAEPFFLAGVRRVLKTTGLPPTRLSLELTESVLAEQNKGYTEILRALRDSGVSIAIDDFGTGYSSLSYLKRFPVTTLKIDRAFIKDIPVDPSDQALVAAIVAMGHGLGLRVVAEGVETVEQEDLLRDHPCEMSQGFLRSRPLPEAEFHAYLERHV